jgi:predicted acetyltransferase
VSRGTPVEIVNPVPADEIAGWVRALSTTFLEDPDGASTARWTEAIKRLWDPSRAWGAWDQGRWVGTLRTEARRLTVPGLDNQTHELAVDAVTNVAVAATHRRRGVMSSMVEASLCAARDRGDAVSVLIAAEWPIYGRFGYAPATLSAEYTLRRSRHGAVVEGEPSRVRPVDLQEFADYAPGVFAAARAERAGQMDRGRDWWNRTLGHDGYPPPASGLPAVWLLHNGPDGADGLLAWRAEGQFNLIPPMPKVNVWNLTAASDTAYRNLWAYLTGIDGADEVTLSGRPIDEPVRWLLSDARTLVMAEHVDFLWLRLLDVPAALTARRYQAPGEVVLEVVDDHVSGHAAGRYRLTTDGDHVSCEPTRADPDLELTERALASIYLGGFRLTPQRLTGDAVERRRGALARVDLMFSTPLAPWNATNF